MDVPLNSSQSVHSPHNSPVSVFNYVPDGLVNGILFRVLLLVAPIQSVLLLSVQGSTAAFILILLSPVILVALDKRYAHLLAFYGGFIIIYALYLTLSLSGYLIDQPDMSRLSVIREIYVFGLLKQTNITQGIYLLAAMLFAYLIYDYYQEAFVKYAFYGILLLSFYGFYEFLFYAIFHANGDILSNRNFGDLSAAAAGVGANTSAKAFVTGSYLEPSNLFGSGYMRLKSLTGEPSMYALSVTPFAVYAFGRRWLWISAILVLSLILSTSSTAVIGLLVGVVAIEITRKREYIVYVALTMLAVLLLYATAEPIAYAINVLLFSKADTTSGSIRIQSFIDHASVAFDGNPLRLLFGLGFGSVRATDMLSNLLANIGFVGLIGYSVLILWPAVSLRRSADRLAIAAALISIFVMEMATVSEYSYLPPWFMIALGYARLREERRATVFGPGSTE